MKKCNNCGHKEYSDTALFCDDCGNDISNVKPTLEIRNNQPNNKKGKIKRIKRIALIQTGKIFATMYALLSIVFIPFFFLSLFSAFGGKRLGFGVLISFGIFILYVFMGFIGGILVAFIYNISAKWVGGIEFEIE